MNTRRTILRTAATAAAVASLPALATSKPLVGISLPLAGVQAVPAREMQIGYAAALDQVANVEFVNDNSNPETVAANVSKFAEGGNYLATTGIVGTPHALKALPAAVAGGLPVVGIRSGASSLRDGNPWVFHLRASFEAEITEILKLAPVYGSVGVLYSDDEFGRGSFAHAKEVAAQLGVPIRAALPVERNGSNVRAQASALAAQQPIGCYLLCLIARPAQEAITRLRELKLVAPIFGMSFIATSELAMSPEQQYQGLALVSPFPLARVDVRDLPASFRARMIERKHENLISSPTAFEAYFYGTVLAEAISKGAATRKALQAYLTVPRPINVKQITLEFDERRVGFHYLALLRKVGQTFRI